MFLWLPSTGLISNFPLVNPSHDRIYYLDFSWNRCFIWHHLGPGGPLMCCYNLVQYIDYIIQIIFLGLPSMGQTPSFPIVTSHSKMLYPDFSWNIRLSIWNHWEQSGHASNHLIFLHPPSIGLTPSFPIFELSHSKILYLNLSWNTRLSIWNH